MKWFITCKSCDPCCVFCSLFCKVFNYFGDPLKADTGTRACKQKLVYYHVSYYMVDSRKWPRSPVEGHLLNDLHGPGPHITLSHLLLPLIWWPSVKNCRSIIIFIVHGQTEKRALYIVRLLTTVGDLRDRMVRVFML